LSPDVWSPDVWSPDVLSGHHDMSCSLDMYEDSPHHNMFLYEAPHHFVRFTKYSLIWELLYVCMFSSRYLDISLAKKKLQYLQ
jgi:hypothetical protein